MSSFVSNINEDDFKTIQKESREIPNNKMWSFWNGNKSLNESELKRLSVVLQKEINSRRNSEHFGQSVELTNYVKQGKYNESNRNGRTEIAYSEQNRRQKIIQSDIARLGKEQQGLQEIFNYEKSSGRDTRRPGIVKLN